MPESWSGVCPDCGQSAGWTFDMPGLGAIRQICLGCGTVGENLHWMANPGETPPVSAVSGVRRYDLEAERAK